MYEVENPTDNILEVSISGVTTYKVIKVPSHTTINVFVENDQYLLNKPGDLIIRKLHD
jgi:hypothetical protein